VTVLGVLEKAPAIPLDPGPASGRSSPPAGAFSSASNPEPCAPVRVGPAGTNGGSRSGPSGSDALSPWWTRVRLFTRDQDGLPLVLVGSLGSALRVGVA
jgi:hypothetical protein